MDQMGLIVTDSALPSGMTNACAETDQYAWTTAGPPGPLTVYECGPWLGSPSAICSLGPSLSGKFGSEGGSSTASASSVSKMASASSCEKRRLKSVTESGPIQMWSSARVGPPGPLGW